MRLTRIPNLDWRMSMSFYQLPPPGNTRQVQSRLINNNGSLGVQVPNIGLPSDRPMDPNLDIKDLRVLQWNAFHLTDHKIAELHQLANETAFDILGVCEVHPVSRHRRPSLLNGYDSPYFTTCEGSKGLTTYVRTGLHWRMREDLLDLMKDFQPKIMLQAIDVTLPNRPKPLVILNVYIHPDTSVPIRRRFWSEL